MPRLKGLWGWLGLATLFTAPVSSAEDSARWLERMTQAVREQSYHGSYVYERSGIFTTQDIWRQATPDGIQERLLQTAGRYQEWVRQDGVLVCATTPAYSQARSPGSAYGLDTQQLTEWYNLRTLGSTRIASRPVTVIAVHPKDGFRYAHELYIDDETGLMLKSLLVDDNRELLERFQFSTISFDRKDYRSGLRPSSSCLPVEALSAQDEAAVPVLEPDWLPPGFSLERRQVQSINGNTEAAVASQIYSDGLASFTLFVEPIGQGSLAEDLRAQLGPTVAVSRRLLAGDEHYLATVVGEIPPRAAERIAESLGRSAAGIAR